MYQSKLKQLPARRWLLLLIASFLFFVGHLFSLSALAQPLGQDDEANDGNDRIESTASCAPLDDSAPFTFVQDELLVKFEADLSSDKIEALNEKLGTEVLAIIPQLEIYQLRMTSEGSVTDTVASYASHSAVIYAEPNYITCADNTHDDGVPVQSEGASDQPTAPDGPNNGDGFLAAPAVTIAMIDTGIDGTDAAFDAHRGQFVGGYDFVNQDDEPMDDHGHGTHVARIATTSSDAQLMAIKVLDETGSGSVANLIQGILYAAHHGADVVNMSLSASSRSIALSDATRYAYHAEVPMICAATALTPHDGDAIGYPAIPYCFTANHERLADFPLMAPEMGWLPLDEGDAMTTPHVTAHAATLLAEHPGMMVDELFDRLRAPLYHRLGESPAKEINRDEEEQPLEATRFNRTAARSSSSSSANITELKLTASDMDSYEHFGYSVSIDGDVAVVGAQGDKENGLWSGAAYVYRWNGSSWQQETKLTPSDGEAGDNFGFSVSISGNLILVGATGDDYSRYASGSAYIFRWNGSSWVEEAKVRAGSYGSFGSSVALNGEVALIAATRYSLSIPGAAYVYRWNGSTWQQEATLTANDGDSGDYFGSSVALSGDVALVGAYRDSSAYVFRWNGSTWEQEVKLTTSNEESGTQFGFSVALSGNMALIGASYASNDLGSKSGAAYMYRFDGSTWQEKAKLTASDGQQSDAFGTSVALNGDIAIIGASSQYSGSDGSGSAYVFGFDGSTWQEDVKLATSDVAKGDQFGRSVSLSGEIALIGAPYDNDNIEDSDVGSAYLYNLSPGNVPDMTLNPTSIKGRSVEGTNNSDTLIIGNSGTETLSWQISSDVAWLTASPTSGTVASGQSQALTINSNLSDMALGFYSGTLTVTSNDLDESEVEVRVLQAVRKPATEVKLSPSDLNPGDRFGFSVSISGDVALIGTPYEDNLTGSAYVYRWNGSSWVEETKLTASDGGGWFGTSVLISDTLALVGSPRSGDSGSVYVYRSNGSQWIEEAKLTPSDESSYEHLGFNLALSGNVAIIAGWDTDVAYVFRWNGSQWQQEARLEPSGNSYGFGSTVAISGDVVLIGAPDDNDLGSQSGAAYLFRWNGSTWEEEVKLTVSDGQQGGRFGQSVALNGNMALIGTAENNDFGYSSGSVYVYRWNGSSWEEESKLNAHDQESGDLFGSAIAFNGDVALIAARGDNARGESSGSAYLFRWNGSSWTEEANLTASDGADYDRFGSIALSDNKALIGVSQKHDNIKGEYVGSAYLYNLSPGDVADISLSTTSIKHTLGEGASGTENLTIGNSGSETLNWSLSSDAAWLTATPSSGTVAPNGSLSVAINIDATNITGGIYPGTLTFTSNDPDEAQLEMPVKLVVRRPVSEIQLSFSEIDAFDYLGSSVSLSGSVALVGAPDNYRSSYSPSSGSGSAYVLRWNGSSWQEEAILSASDGSSDDRFGSSVSISGDLALVGAPYDDDNGSNSGSAYLFRWNGSSWVEEAKIRASDGRVGKQFGYSVSISGDVALVGTYQSSAYVFRWNGSRWVQEAKLSASDQPASFGNSVSQSGNVALVGAPGEGSAYVFRWNGSSWQGGAKLLPSDGVSNNQFGYSVSLSGNMALIGAYKDNEKGSDSGSVYAFGWDGSTWQEQGKLLASDGSGSDYFGFSVSLNGDMALIGAYNDNDNGNYSGSAYLFGWNGESWVEQAKLLATDGTSYDNFGFSVALSGEMALVGAIRAEDEIGGSEAGSAYLYNLSRGNVADINLNPTGIQNVVVKGETTANTLTISNPGSETLDWAINGAPSWVSATPAEGSIPPNSKQLVTLSLDATSLAFGAYRDTLTITSNDPDEQSTSVRLLLRVVPPPNAKLLANDGTVRDYFGTSVSLSGDLGLVGASGDNSNRGSAYVYRWNGDNWQQEQKLFANDGSTGDAFGSSVSISGTLALVGAPQNDDSGQNSGSAYIYRWNGSSWQREAKLIASDGSASDQFGSSVSVSGNLALVGASTAAYVFRWNGSIWVEDAILEGSNGVAGIAVSLSNNVALIGSGANRAYVFRWNGSSWVEEAMLQPSDGSINFGSSLSLNDDIALVGAKEKAYVYRSNGSSWIEEAILEASDKSANDYFGSTVSLSGDMALIGAYYDDDNGLSSGSAYIYRWNGSQWVEKAKLVASDGGSGDFFGESVSIDANVAFVGANRDDDNGKDSGSVYMYNLSSLGDAPDIALSPASLSVTLGEDESSSETLTISNTGDAALTFDLSEQGASSDDWSVLAFPAEKVEPGLADEIQTTGEEDFLLYLSEQADLSQAYTMSDWQARGEYVYQTLWNTAQKSQADLLAFLDSEVQNGNISGYNSFYLVNAVQVTGTFATLDSLAVRDDIAYIEGVKEFTIPEPEIVSGDSLDGVEWGISKIRADQVWNDLDVRGNGIVVANIDSGVLSSHAALVNQYRGTATGSHDYNWFDSTGTYATAPGDNNGHGTHVMGTMVGNDGGSNQIGVAPGAQWIAAKGCSSSSCSSTHLLAAAEWMLAPYPIGGTPENGDASKRPHVVNNSWGGSGGRLLYQASVNAWRAADIFPAFSAGNKGPNAGTVASPADYADSFAIGATDSTDTIASFSSRGPSSLTDETKPDVSAPGVNVRSAWNNGDYHTISGTSMASPHTAGCVALIKAANPSLNVATIEELLTNTATDLGSSGPDDAYGHGRIDCYEAITSMNRNPDVPWLTLNPTTGNVEPNNSQNINVSVDSTGLTAGTYRAKIGINSNDPNEASIQVPVTLVVGGYDAPTAAFSASVEAGGAPLTVQFSDSSSGAITSWTWDFGDGTISGARYPEHTYWVPGSYTVSLTVSGPGGEDSETKEAYITVNEPDEVNTLILTNRQKVEYLHSDASATQLMSKLGELAAHERVQGLVIQVENEPSVASAYAAWDANPTSTENANAVTSAIKGVVDAKLASYPDVEYIVVAGDDRVIPFRRVRDKTWYSEKRYRYNVSCDGVTGAALCDDMTLTDDYYADHVPFVPRSRGWDGHQMYLPDFGIGRLIETPQEMMAQIDTFLGDDGISVSNAAVTGYSFVTDAAAKSCRALNDAGVTTDCTLVQQNWSKNDFITNVLDYSHDIVSINGHADHYRIGVPNGSSVTSDDIANAPDIHQGAIFYTIACHAGLNVPPSNRYPLDTAQAFAQKQANYVANTGYGYGYRYSVGLSEQLMIDFTEQLTGNGSAATLGQALAAAKQQYYLRSYRFGYYDEKILIESTLYGLPMYEITSPSSQRAPLSEAAQDLPEGVIVEEIPIPLDGEFSKTQLRFELPALTEETTDEGTYYRLGELVHSEHGEPMQPKLPFAVSVSGTKAHGLVFKGGTYSDTNYFDPVIAEAFTLTLPSAVPTFAEPPFTETNWYPAIPSQLNILDNGAKAQLTTLLGQYNSSIEGGTERLYSDISFDVYYHTDSDDWSAPTIASVSSELAAGTATVTVSTSDDSGIHEVLVTYSDNQYGTWQSVSLSDNGDTWSGAFSATESTDFFVQVVDKAGNVSVDDNNGAYYQPESESGGQQTQIELVPGWNLVSLPVQPDNTTIADVLASIDGNYSVVQSYNGCDTLDPWKKFDPNPPPFSPPNDLTEIDQTIGFWINMTAADTLELTGVERATTIALCSGWNMVAYPSVEEQAVGDALDSITGAYTVVNQYDAADSADPWKKFDPYPPPFSPPNDLNVVSPGFGYWIKVKQAIEWIIGD